MSSHKMHVIPDKGLKKGWIVKEEGVDGVTQHYDTKEGAVAAAEGIAGGDDVDIKIHPESESDEFKVIPDEIRR